LKTVELIYTELFILKHRKNIVYLLAESTNTDNKTFGFNLPSFYFIETFLEDIKNLFEYADIVFANFAEAIFFGKLLGLETDDVEEICLFLSKMPKKNKNKMRTVVITCGPDPAFVCQYDHKKNIATFSCAYEPNQVEEDNIVDTNGAGDAFAGGFLANYVRGASLDKCMKAGHWAAALIIQTRGCQIPDTCEFVF
jgi:adenosine kinase